MNGRGFTDGRGLTYALHGLRLQSEVPLPEPPCENEAPDLMVRWGAERANSLKRPAGKVLAERDPGPEGYTLVQTGDDDLMIRYYGVCDFRLSPRAKVIEVDAMRGADLDLVPTLLIGNVLNFILELQGRTVLHASAVHVAGSTIAIAGVPGGGKSTLAALFCSAGADLVTDDLLRIEVKPQGIQCFAGMSEVRLRPGWASLAEHFSPRSTRETVDGRIAVLPRKVEGERFPLTAVLFPVRRRSSQTVSFERLGPADIVRELIAHQRVTGWQVVEPVRAHFLAVADVATRTPAFRLEVELVPPAPESLARTIIDHVSVISVR